MVSEPQKVGERCRLIDRRVARREIFFSVDAAKDKKQIRLRLELGRTQAQALGPEPGKTCIKDNHLELLGLKFRLNKLALCEPRRGSKDIDSII